MVFNRKSKAKLTIAYLLVYPPNILQNLVDAPTHSLWCQLHFLRSLIPRSFQERPLVLVVDLETNKQIKNHGESLFLTFSWPLIAIERCFNYFNHKI